MVELYRHQRKTGIPTDLFSEDEFPEEDELFSRTREAIYWFLAERFYEWGRKHLKTNPWIRPYIFTSGSPPRIYDKYANGTTRRTVERGNGRHPNYFRIHAPSVSFSWKFIKKGGGDLPPNQFEVEFFVFKEDIVPAVTKFAEQLETELPQRLPKGIDLKHVEIHVFE